MDPNLRLPDNPGYDSHCTLAPSCQEVESLTLPTHRPEMVGFDLWPPEVPSASTEIPQIALSQLEKPNAKQESTVVLRPDDIERTKKLIGSEQLRGYRLIPLCVT